MTCQLLDLHPYKKGKLAKDQNDKLVLLNDNGRAFSTNDAVLVIWQLCTGDQSVKSICSGLKEHSNEPDFEYKVSLVIEKLKNADLIDLKEFKSLKADL